ncbi:hypothetical protein HMPREF1872_00698 [Amygdalobacter nucleatus]|uniref:Uncharacterized protein n=1 Tax=Amygdalobacter nucleatus TaxID=3029274 RepID=A0A133YDZ3_9FIRM|nr:hypothetical protein HMPREF1872_00698 [Amygdalobacter nucleatus]
MPKPKDKELTVLMIDAAKPIAPATALDAVLFKNRPSDKVIIDDTIVINIVGEDRKSKALTILPC